MARVSFVVSPGSRRTELVGRHGEAWKIRVAAPPERGRANRELERWLADALAVPPDTVRVKTGASTRRKTVEISSLDDGAASARLAAIAEA